MGGEGEEFRIPDGYNEFVVTKTLQVMIPDICKNYQKVIYLDSDLVIHTDMKIRIVKRALKNSPFLREFFLFKI